VSAGFPLPTTAETKAVIPDHCFERILWRSAMYAVMSLVLTVGTGILAWQFLPLHWAWTPAWVLYAIAVGTFATGLWVVAHECGHRAFSKGTRLQDTVGFVLHSALLVPYFSWQRSHAIHHGKTNHLTEGETHVPKRFGTRQGRRTLAVRDRLGPRTHGVLTILGRLIAGWPLYLLVGATGGPERGLTNHFWPSKPFSSALFPNRWARKVRWSAAGVLVTLGLLAWWAIAAGSIWPVVALYVGPYLVCNMWLVAYTWLQHTDEDIPHYADDDWSFVRGAFCSVDRPYGRLIDLLHHRIGSTHVAHHLDAKIPHYHAAAATTAIANAFPHLYRYDPTPVPKALWRVAKNCHVVAPASDGWQFTDSGERTLETAA
jgi:omega-6 fatty acid desaturase (delta-12 desaturase)